MAGNKASLSSNTDYKHEMACVDAKLNKTDRAFNLIIHSFILRPGRETNSSRTRLCIPLHSH